MDEMTVSSNRLTQLLQVIALLGNSLDEDEFQALKQAVFAELGVEVSSSQSAKLTLGLS